MEISRRRFIRQAACAALGTTSIASTVWNLRAINAATGVDPRLREFRVDAVTGPYDVVVLTEAHNVDELGKMIVSKVQLVPSITRTLTCSVVHL